MKTSSRLRAAPVLLMGLVAVAVFGQTPSGDAPIRWTLRSGDAWMADWDGVRDVRLAAAAAAVHIAADQTPMALDGTPIVLEPKAPQPPTMVIARPVLVDVKPIVVAEADLPPRDVPKQVPADAPEPEITGTNAAAPTAAAPSSPRVLPTVNRDGKTDRLFSPVPFGRTTEQGAARPVIAEVTPSRQARPSDPSVVALAAPQPEPAPSGRAQAPAPGPDGRVIVALVRSGPGRVVTQSAIASLGERDRHAPRKGPIVLPPVPDAQVATLPPRSQVWAQPDVPAIGYAKTDDVENRFKSLLGDEADQATPPANPSDDQLPP